jgi:hypothetical protein
MPPWLVGDLYAPVGAAVLGFPPQGFKLEEDYT